MGPTNLDVTADAAHLSAHFTSSGQWEGAGLTRIGKNWQTESRAFHSMGPASGRLGLWTGTVTDSAGHWFTSRGGHPCQSAQIFSA